MEDAKRSILTRVVEGAITPEQAAAELEDLEALGAQHSNPVATAEENPETPFGTKTSPSTLARVKVITQMGSVTVIGDPSVQDVVADGPHVARREGDTMFIEVDPISHDAHFRFGRMGINIGDGRRLVIRMNPNLALDADVQAGSLKVHQVAGPIRAVIQAGSMLIEDFRSPFDISVSAGSFKARGRMDSGQFRVRCDAGSVKLQLAHDSSVRVRARTTMGKIALPGGHRSSVGFGDRDEVTIGEGAAQLDIEATMGSVLVSTDS